MQGFLVFEGRILVFVADKNGVSRTCLGGGVGLATDVDEGAVGAVFGVGGLGKGNVGVVDFFE